MSDFNSFRVKQSFNDDLSLLKIPGIQKDQGIVARVLSCTSGILLTFWTASESKTLTVTGRKCRVNLETIHYYERRGLLPMLPGSESSYRQFLEETLEQIKFIKNAKELGFTLSEISELLSLRLGPSSTCVEVQKS